MTTLFALVRAAHFVSLMTIFGAAALSALAGLRRSEVRRVLAWSSLAALVTAVLSLGFTTAQMTGDAGAAVDVASLGTVVAQTFYGNVFVVRFVLLAGVCLLCVVDAGPALTAAVAGVALALLGLTSHAAAAGDPRYEYLRAANDAAHLLAAGFWVGGLVALLPPLFGRDTSRLVARLRLFSGWGTAAVAILIAAGTLNGVAILGGADAHWSGAYLTWLAAKLVLAGFMIALALTNRFGVTPALARGEKDAAETIPITLVGELACAGAILLIVGFLGLTAPMSM